MSGQSSECSHLNQVTDMTCGDIICTDCGLVVDRVFTYSHVKVNEDLKIRESKNDFLAELLEKLHLPHFITAHVEAQLDAQVKIRAPSNLLIAQCLYQALAKLNIPITSRDICSVSGFSSKNIQADSCIKTANEKDVSNIVFLEIDDIIDRICGKLSLSYKDCTLIKNSVQVRYSGYNPSTVASSYIYLYCKQNKLKLKLKTICTVSGISCMSVHRFIKKHDLSFRSKSSEG